MKTETQPKIKVQLQVCKVLFLEEAAKEYIEYNFLINPDETLYVAVVQEEKPNGDLIRQKAILTDNTYQYEVGTEFLKHWIEYKVVPNEDVIPEVLYNLFQ